MRNMTKALLTAWVTSSRYAEIYDLYHVLWVQSSIVVCLCSEIIIIKDNTSNKHIEKMIRLEYRLSTMMFQLQNIEDNFLTEKKKSFKFIFCQ